MLKKYPVLNLLRDFKLGKIDFEFAKHLAQLCNMTTMAYHVSFDLNDGVIDHVLQLYETPEVPHVVKPTISHSSSSQNAR